MALNSDSSLATPMLLTVQHYNVRKSKDVKKITPHHAAGVNATLAGMRNIFQNRSASSNYGIDSFGNIGLYVHEKDRAWASSNGTNDNQAITFEIANCKGAPNWEVSDAAVKAMIYLAVDVCKRNEMPGLNWTGDKNGTLTIHQMFAATACCGPYLKALMPWVAQEVSDRVSGKKSENDPIIIPKIPGMDPGKKAPTKPACMKVTPQAQTKPVQPTPVPAPVKKSFVYGGIDLAPVFNPDYYCAKYPDLQKAYGKNVDGLFNHFCKYGLFEGRQAISTFNPVAYKNRYADLQKAFGNTWIKYYQHYLLYGIKEGRIGY